MDLHKIDWREQAVHGRSPFQPTRSSVIDRLISLGWVATPSSPAAG